MTKLPDIHTMLEMEERVLDLGFLPFFRCGIPGFSIEEMTPRELWWPSEPWAPWEWKGPVIKEGHCAYGKIFNKKAGYVSLEWLPDMVNYRRSKPLAYNEDIAALDDIVLQTIDSEGSATIKELRRLLSFTKGRGKRHSADEPVDTLADNEKINIEPILVRLMMELRIVIADFEYNRDRHGNPYGWGIARYATPETLYGYVSIDRTPEESYSRMLQHLKRLFPDAPEKHLRKLLQ